ncbi:hypothetical protein Pflav_042580 [Phytohabitans flavus]|uniref:Uncharacterized protein n=1 Tax=Phytohabitans flavus TaxID=1076124 RepID=A0A6F8XVT1_9ACTN|nr:hypothetical protein Pflav_042580 [Phytohabitans flavus]
MDAYVHRRSFRLRQTLDDLKDKALSYRDVRGGPDRRSRSLTLRASHPTRALFGGVLRGADEGGFAGFGAAFVAGLGEQVGEAALAAADGGPGG